MEEKNKVKINIVSIILSILVIILIFIIGYLVIENQKVNNQISKNIDNTNNNSQGTMNETNTLVNQLNSQLNDKNQKIEQLEKEISELKKSNSGTQTSSSTTTYEITTLKNLRDVISDDDTEIIKAKKIAKEVETAVNSKDWYYLAKIVGSGSDPFIKYGIYNYTIDTERCEQLNGHYVFSENYDWDKNILSNRKDALGGLLVISFENGGRISVTPLCTGP